MEENKSGNHIKLEGASNWNVWKFQSIILLRSHDLLEVVQGTKVKPEAEAEKPRWEKLDAKAQTWLVTRMSESAMMHILTCTTSAQMWRKLASVYEQKSETTIHIVQQRFFQYKYEEGTEMSTFLSKIEEMTNQLNQMGESISEKFVITKVLMSLPECYKHFVSAWESAPDDKQTYDNLVARLLIEEERLKEKREVDVSSKSTSSAFVAKKIDKKDVKCYKCNNKGHFQSECRNKRNNNSESENKSGKKCFYCKKMGHLKSECWFKKNKNKETNAFVTVSASGHFQKAHWIVDTGASNHMCRDRDLFTAYSPSLSNKSVTVGNGNLCSVHGFGQMSLQVYDGDKWIDTTIENVLFVPELKTNLLSVNCITDRGYVVVTDNEKCKFLKQNKVCAVAYRNQDMYLLDVRYKHGIANVAKVQSSLKDWHEKLVHQNMQHVKNVLKNNNIVVTDDADLKCESCLEGKIHRLPFNTSETKTTRTCELIHADTCGPFEVPSVGGSRYFVILKDDYSNYRSVYCVKGKDDVKKCIKNFINKAENITKNKVLYFRSDNGLEFVNREVQDLFSRRGIIHQTTVPYTAEQNGRAEREIRTLTEAARTMLCDLPKKLWAEAIITAAYVLNRTSKSKEVGKTPYETWNNKHYDINNLKVFGTPVYVHIPKEKRRKLDSKGEKGIMVGYGEDVKGYRVFFQKNNSVEVKRDVVFLERGQEEKEQVVQLDYDIDTPESISEEQLSREENPTEGEVLTSESVEQKVSCGSERPPGQVVASPNVSTKTLESDGSTYVPCTRDEASSDEGDENIPPRKRSARVRKQTSFYNCHHVSSEVTEPKTYKEAMSRKDASEWQKAIKRELQTLKDNNTWKSCEKPVGEKTVSSKWVFKIKNCDQYKARLVARGFEQNDMLDSCEIYAPVAKLSTFRLFVSVATKLKLPIYQMDVTGAFLYGNIDETVYLELPEGAYSGNKNVVKLNKSLYGLKKSPKYWNDKFNSVIIKQGFVRSLSDTCLYTKHIGNSKTYVLLYVDDLLIFGNDSNEICNLKSMLNREFQMKDLGLVCNFLGIKVIQDLENGITKLSQKEYLENVLRKFEMHNCKEMSTPMDLNFNAKSLEEKKSVIDKNIEKKCRKIIGSLSYAALGTRPDICVAVSILSRYQNHANNTLLMALKRVLRYIKYTINYCLVYKCNNDMVLGYCDANWGGDLKDRKSTTGYCFKFANCLITWCSKKQASVSLSSTQSEYVAISMAASEACWLINLLQDFDIKNVCPVVMLSDSQSAIMAANTDCVKRLKHIDIRFHYIKELIKKGKILLKYIKTEDQTADMFTKALNKNLLCKFINNCGITCEQQTCGNVLSY